MIARISATLVILVFGLSAGLIVLRIGPCANLFDNMIEGERDSLP